MITKNWYKVAACLVTATSANSQKMIFKKFTGENTTFTVSDYLWAYALGYCASTVLTSANVNSSTKGVLFGTGDTPATLEDYTLAGGAISNISVSKSFTTTGNAAEAEYAELSTLYTITNTGTEDITIKEIALVCLGCVMERTVLESPITIPVGGVGQVTYTIRMNYPTV